MSVSDYDRAHIKEIVFGGQGTWFTAHLLRLCAKADSSNLERLRVAFPDVVEAYLEWRDAA